MISVRSALAFERLKVAPRVQPEPELTDEQAVQFDYVDAVVESLIYKHFEGKMFSVPIPAKFVNVIDAIQRRYEDGGWSVGVFPQIEGDQVNTILLVLSPGQAAVTVKKDAPVVGELPPVIAPSTSSTTEKPWDLLVRMPTRGRPAQALAVLQKYREMAGCPITIEVVIDEDDETMMASEVLQRLNALDCIVTVGQHRSKVEAVNGGRWDKWDVLLLASDDMVPVKFGFAVDVLNAMEKHFPYLDGAIYFNDGYARERCCTLPVIGRKFYDQLVIK